MEGIGALDIIMGMLLLWGMWRGFKNGLILEVAAIVALIAGIYGAVHFSDVTATYLTEKVQLNIGKESLGLLSFLVTFALVALGVHWAGKLLTHLIKMIFLGKLNSLAGALFGALKIALVLGAVLVYFEEGYTQLGIIDEESKTASRLFIPIQQVGHFFFDRILPEALRS